MSLNTFEDRSQVCRYRSLDNTKNNHQNFEHNSRSSHPLLSLVHMKMNVSKALKDCTQQDTDQTPHNGASDQGLHCLPLIQQFLAHHFSFFWCLRRAVHRDLFPVPQEGCALWFVSCASGGLCIVICFLCLRRAVHCDLFPVPQEGCALWFVSCASGGLCIVICFLCLRRAVHHDLFPVPQEGCASWFVSWVSSHIFNKLFQYDKCMRSFSKIIPRVQTVAYTQNFASGENSKINAKELFLSTNVKFYENIPQKLSKCQVTLKGSIFLKNRHFLSKKGLMNWYIVLIWS